MYYEKVSHQHHEGPKLCYPPLTNADARVRHRRNMTNAERKHDN